MTAAHAEKNELHFPDWLPLLRGRVRMGVELSAINWFRTGGKAEIFFKPDDYEDLAAFLRAKPKDVPIFAMGVGSNLIIRDGGLPGVVLRLGGHFAEVEAQGDEIHAGAGALSQNVALAAQGAGLSGLEFLSGIPGTIGGALAMNAGAYGAETANVLIEVEAVDDRGERHTLKPEYLGYHYRGCELPPGWIFTGAVFKGIPGDQKAITKRMTDIKEARESTQPVRERTGGSTFKNPDGEKAWQLIEAAGCRGLKVGGAQMSEKHCNFMINTGTATSQDLESLGEEVRRRVHDKFGVWLEWEIARVGNP